ncbi:DUF2808 domain-containing protein [Iningainema tapete]|uniref:DUF2808 domain-containing protein n=1 Tax=Iningainema tapete BLCC-T55 TaxID=2748662 RepID=A0A8J6XKX8_9CYAN|nr:DUF2808 domain-containing protein [Iningainema tapete]MBD2772327.1 DUF2808 domain-containing protein [Iningainema tapete BLCC-T55]
MKKILIYTALVIATAILIPTNYASANLDDSTAIHIDGNVQFPPNRWRTVRHSFRVHIPKNGKAVNQLIIKVPSSVTVSNNIKNIDVEDENEQKISTNASVEGKTVRLVFPEPVAPNSILHIDLNNVQRRNFGNGHVYRFSATVVGSKAEIPVGVAWFRMY